MGDGVGTGVGVGVGVATDGITWRIIFCRPGVGVGVEVGAGVVALPDVDVGQLPLASNGSGGHVC